MIAGWIIFVIIVGFAIAIRLGWRPSLKREVSPTSPAKGERHEDGHAGAAESRRDWWQILGGIATFLIVGWLAFALGSCTMDVGGAFVAWANKPAATSPAATVATPLDECSTPCKMYVGWDTSIKSGGRPYRVRFAGKEEWLERTGRAGDMLTLDQFSPGEAEFASPENDSTPVEIELHAAK